MVDYHTGIAVRSFPFYIAPLYRAECDGRPLGPWTPQVSNAERASFEHYVSAEYAGDHPGREVIAQYPPEMLINAQYGKSSKHPSRWRPTIEVVRVWLGGG